MPLAPGDWNVVVLGRWNRAILTPKGIAKRLFDLPEGTKLEIGVPVDAIGPYRVKHGGLVVMVDENRLIVEALSPDYQSLQSAMSIAWRALDQLRETPVAAAGYNMRFQCGGDSEEAHPLIDATELPWDRRFGDSGYPILQREVTWAVGWEAGRISTNLIREQGDSEIKIGLNFERSSTSIEELKDWLQMPIAKIVEQQRRIFSSIFYLQPEAVG
jgi:hypothetical protein